MRTVMRWYNYVNEGGVNEKLGGWDCREEGWET